MSFNLQTREPNTSQDLFHGGSPQMGTEVKIYNKVWLILLVYV